MEQILKNMQNLALQSLEEIFKFAEENKLTNSQEFLNFLDTLNEYSIRY